MLGIMKVFVVLGFCVLAISAAKENAGKIAPADSCYKTLEGACSSPSPTTPDLKNCNITYSAINSVVPELSRYVSQHVRRSFDYLVMATHFANYEKNRDGFYKLFKGLSDEKWEASIDLIKYIAKRGGNMDWKNTFVTDGETLELYELPALGKALDIEKEFTKEAVEIHRKITRKLEEHHDPEISDHIEHEYTHKQRDNIRKLGGYVSDLVKIMDGPDGALGLYLFDDYLQKQ